MNEMWIIGVEAGEMKQKVILGMCTTKQIALDACKTEKHFIGSIRVGVLFEDGILNNLKDFEFPQR